MALFVLIFALSRILNASASSCVASWLCTVTPLTYATFGLAWVVKGLTSSTVFTFTFLVFNWCDVINIIPKLVCNSFCTYIFNSSVWVGLLGMPWTLFVRVWFSRMVEWCFLFWLFGKAWQQDHGPINVGLW